MIDRVDIVVEDIDDEISINVDDIVKTSKQENDNKMDEVNSQISSKTLTKTLVIKKILQENIEKAIENAEPLAELSNKASDLQNQSEMFSKSTEVVHKEAKQEYISRKTRLAFLTVALPFLLVVILVRFLK